ncbi:hypothetical protein G6F59_016431 [Rhizopus arrhizus]|nr:hypothetical protein G6F59_016431 [Rhizopus arrhizus]
MRIHVGDRLGSINNQAHVHLAVGNGGFETNAVALGFRNYADHFAPRITGVALLDDNDQPMAAGGDGGVMVARQGGLPDPRWRWTAAAGLRAAALEHRVQPHAAAEGSGARGLCTGQWHYRARQRGDPVPLPGHQHRA